MDISLDATGDLLIGDDGDLVLIEGVDATRQHLQISLQFFQGEWSLDLRIGVPYFQEILGKGRDLNAIRAIFREAILQTEKVTAVSDLALDYDGVTRALSVSFQTQSTEGPIDFDQELIIPAVQV